MIQIARYTGVVLSDSKQLVKIIKIGEDYTKDISLRLDFTGIIHMTDNFAIALQKYKTKSKQKVWFINCNFSVSKKIKEFEVLTVEHKAKVFLESEKPAPAIEVTQDRLTDTLKTILDKPHSSKNFFTFEEKNAEKKYKQNVKKIYPKINLGHKDLIYIISILQKDKYSIQEIKDRLHVSEDYILNVINI